MIFLRRSLLKTLLTSIRNLNVPLECFYSSKFRDKFVTRFGPVNMTSWFPGHMYKGTLQLQAKLAVVDCIIEVHDARIPFSGRNPKFFSMFTAIRPHILLLNKCDLTDMSRQDEIVRSFQRENIQHVIFTSCKEHKKGIQKVTPLAVQLIKDSDLYNRGNRAAYTMMVIGIPNVGKSSVINRLRNYNLNKKSASAVGAVPGITKSVLEKIKISDHPIVYLYDSPGIIQPNIDTLEIGLKLALCRTLKDEVVGMELMADYLLYWLNKHKNVSYAEYLNLEEPTDDVRLLILQIAKNMNKVKRVNNATGNLVNVPDIDACCKHFVSAFREGKFGKVLLDVDYLHNA